jgi:xylulokinase
MAFFIGIDSGTQSTKAVVLDLESGQIVGEARSPHSLIPNLPLGAAEQHPSDWTRALDAVILGALQKVDRSRVMGIGVSGQQHGFVPLDAGGEVIRPAKLWCDTSTGAECALLTKKLGGDARAIRKIGLPFLPGYTAPKILWLKRHEPRHYRRLRHVLLPHDYLNFHLTGHYRMEYGDASGTALLDVRRRRWSPEAIRAIDPRLGDWLPPLTASDTVHGLLRPDRARAYGLREEVIVSSGGGDNMMGAIGTGNVRPGVVTASFGTSGTIYAHAAKPVVDPAGEIAAFCASTDGWLPLLCTMNVTAVTERVGNLLGYDHAAYDAAVASTGPGAQGVLFLPYLAGERTPNLPGASGTLTGVNGSNLTGPALARAAMEGVTMGMNYGLGRLRALGVRPREIRVTGGGAKSAVWRQLMADIFGVPIVAMAQDEGAALGAAIQAAWCLQRRDLDPRAGIGALTDRLVAVKKETRCVPDKSRAAYYRKAQKLFTQCGAALSPLYSAQRDLARRG